MENCTQTKITDSNREQFFRNGYRVQSLKRSELIDLDLYQDMQLVAVDSCGWYYQDQFPTANIIKVEGIQTCKTYKFPRTHFDKLFDDRQQVPSIPTLNIKNSVLILDQSPTLFKYRDIAETRALIYQCCQAVNAKIARVRIPLMTFGDCRFCDRITSLVGVVPDNYITTLVYYNTKALDLEFRRKVDYEFSID